MCVGVCEWAWLLVQLISTPPDLIPLISYHQSSLLYKLIALSFPCQIVGFGVLSVLSSSALPVPVPVPVPDRVLFGVFVVFVVLDVHFTGFTVTCLHLHADHQVPAPPAHPCVFAVSSDQQ